METDMVSIGKRIKERRKELRLTQTDIKRECGISSGALSEIENGNRTPSVITFHMLAQVLDCSMDWLTTGTSPNEKISTISSCEEKLLNGFRELPEDDQEELIGLLEMKLRKTHKAKEASAKSSELTDTKRGNMVG